MWLQEVGKRGWVALTHNKEIRYTPGEKDMAMRAGVPLFILIGKDSHEDLARNFLVTLEKIETFLAEHEPPFIAKIKKRSREALQAGKPGRVELWLTYDEWKST